MILVTGANGFIGHHLVRALLAQGEAVRGLVRPGSDRRSLDGLPVELVEGDILQPETLPAAVAGCRLVYHAAAVFAYWGHRPEALRHLAEAGTEHILRAAQAAGVSRVVLTGSSVIWGGGPQPQARTEASLPDLGGAAPYVLAKVAQVQAAEALAASLDLDLVTVCPTLTIGGPDYGPTESNRALLAYLMDPYKSTWPGGCNLVAATDIAAAHLLAAARGTRGARYLAGGENLQWETVHTWLSELSGLPGPWLRVHHSSAYLAATAYELASRLTGEPPLTTRAQARMVGRYYWYDHSRLADLGYQPQPARDAVVAALSWLLRSGHLPASLRARMQLAPEVQAFSREIPAA